MSGQVQTVTCPNCRQPFTATSGAPAWCPSCRHPVTIGTLAPPPVPSPPLIVPTMAPRPQSPEKTSMAVDVRLRVPKPLKARGWFTRAFAATSAVLICYALYFLFLRQVIWHDINSIFSEPAAAMEKDRKEARDFAVSTLKRFGVTSVSEEVEVVDLGRSAGITGLCKDRHDRIREFTVGYRKATFDGVETWEVVYVSLDGDVIHGEKP